MTFKPLDELRAVRHLQGLSSTARIVLHALILRADEHGACWPSFETIGADAGMDPRSAKRTVKTLVAAGHVSAERRRVEGRTTSNLYRVHLVHTGVTDDPTGVTHDHSVLSDIPSPSGVTDDHPRGDTGSQDLPNELPIGTAQFALARSEGDPERALKAKKKAKRGPKHTPEEIAAKDLVVAAFIEGVQARKGVTPKLTHKGDHAAAFALATAYPEEACAIVCRALDDAFVLRSNCTLRYIAGKADTWRGTAPIKATARMVQPGPADGSTPGWKLRQEARRRAEGEPPP